MSGALEAEDVAQARSARLRRLMKDHGLTAKAIGLLINRNPKTVLNYACGNADINEKTLMTLEQRVWGFFKGEG
jgi:transcriptional regulator with XRE-family HTH domain